MVLLTMALPGRDFTIRAEGRRRRAGQEPGFYVSGSLYSGIHEDLIMRHHTIHLKPLLTILVGAVLTALSPQASAISAELTALQNAIKEQNERGYGKTISSELTRLTIYNKTGLNGDSRTLKVRALDKYGKWSKDTQLPPGSALTYSMADTRQISLNGDGGSDDIKINDTKGYVEYVSDQSKGKNLWANMMTWNGETKRWLMTSLFDKISGDETVLLPHIHTGERQLTITLIDGHNYGTTISNTYKWIRILNSTQSFTFPIRYQDDKGDWKDDGEIGPGQQSSWRRTDTTKIFSLNGKDNNDDLKINNDKGYIEFNIGKVTGSLMGITMKEKMVWVTQAWFHPVINQWYGQGTWSNIDGQGGGGADLPSVTLTPKFGFPTAEDITFELKDKAFIPPK